MRDKLLANPSTNTSPEVQEDVKQEVVPPPPAPKRRERRIGDIINFDGVLYRVYKLSIDARKVGLKRLNNEEVKSFLIKQRQMQEAAIRKVKEMKIDPKRVIDMPVEPAK